MKRVILESPFAGKGRWPLRPIRRWLNKRYARRCLRDSLLRGEAPLASHLLYTQPGVLRDHVPAERQHGIYAGFAWREHAVATVVYIDRGISGGMQAGINEARALGQPIEYRTLKEKGPSG